MSLALDEYVAANAKLREFRASSEVYSSAIEEPLLDAMANIWLELDPHERELLKASEAIE